ncbi:hypothetical protein [Verrucosispora sp. WMMD1129]|uniref:hypothetical protein n=1 Tax=Verrucosispora sp. WMMD1129 TaxID=3016093 RepID=UPI00249A7A02|nr:hypothetical protein [Verrucosispora sp. WMMD1129]WFE45295.1 hypothetical protein O7624_13520 [Verrucosispora sp. WMMD1129]
MKRGSIAIGAALVALGLAGGVGVAQLTDRPEPQPRDVVVRTVSDDDATPTATPDASPDSTTGSPAAEKTSKERDTTVTEQQTTEAKPTPAPTARRTTGTGTADIVPDPLPEPAEDIRRCYKDIDGQGPAEVPCD